MRNYKKNPNFSSPAGQRRRKSQNHRRSRRSSTSFKNSRKITKRTKEPSPTSNTLPSPEYLLSPEKSPETAGRLKREEKLRKNVMELKKEGQPENPPLLPQFRARRKNGLRRRKMKVCDEHTHPHGSDSNFTSL